jgi:hypothetical protein
VSIARIAAGVSDGTEPASTRLSRRVSEVGRRLCDRRFSIVFVKKKRAVGIRT